MGDEIAPDEPYVVVDTKTKQIVYKTTYKNRIRARRWADKKDNEYGAYRYYPMLLQNAEKIVSKGESNMLSTLFKLAYKLDKQGKYDEAKEIEAVMKELTLRVGLDPEEIVSLANFFDEHGETAIANRFDAMIKETAKKKTLYKTHKGPGEKKPEGAKHKAPKEWFNKMKKDVKKKNPDWDDKRVSEVVGDIWDNELSDKKREQIYNRAGKKKSPNA